MWERAKGGGKNEKEQGKRLIDERRQRKKKAAQESQDKEEPCEEQGRKANKKRGRGRERQTLEDTTTNRNVAGERALLVNVGSFNSFLGGLDTQTNASEEAGDLVGLTLLGGVEAGSTGDELSLERLFSLKRERKRRKNEKKKQES